MAMIRDEVNETFTERCENEYYEEDMCSYRKQREIELGNLEPSKRNEYEFAKKRREEIRRSASKTGMSGQERAELLLCNNTLRRYESAITDSLKSRGISKPKRIETRIFFY